MKVEKPVINDYFGEFGEVLSEKIEELDYDAAVLLREASAERKRELDTKLAEVGKGHRTRPGLVSENQSLAKLLQQVNKSIKVRNIKSSPPLKQIVESEGLTVMDLWAGLAMHALLSQQTRDPDDNVLAKKAWAMAEAMDDEAR
jgi:hypothetical protein